MSLYTISTFIRSKYPEIHIVTKDTIEEDIVDILPNLNDDKYHCYGSEMEISEEDPMMVPIEHVHLVLDPLDGTSNLVRGDVNLVTIVLGVYYTGDYGVDYNDRDIENHNILRFGIIRQVFTDYMVYGYEGWGNRYSHGVFKFTNRLYSKNYILVMPYRYANVVKSNDDDLTKEECVAKTLVQKLGEERVFSIGGYGFRSLIVISGMVSAHVDLT